MGVTQNNGASHQEGENHRRGASLGAVGTSRRPPEKAKEKDMKVTRLRTIDEMAGEEGFEPSLTGPGPVVLPLDDSPATDVTQSKSSPLPGLLNTIMPLNLPQKAARIGQLIQSQLPNPLRPIISPHPADINAPAHFRHSSLVPAVFSPIYRLIQGCLRPSSFLFRGGMIEVGGDQC